MKGVIIYDSTNGNTRQVAEAITEGLTGSGINADLFHVKDVKKLHAAGYDFLAVGSPTKCGAASLAVKGFLGKIKQKEWKDKPFMTFDTENPENIEAEIKSHKNFCAGDKLAGRLRDKRMKQMLPSLRSLVTGWKGPMEDGEIEKARNYGRKFASALMG
jgi:flavodoxin